METLRISTNPADLDLPMIHRFLCTRSSWAQGIPIETVQRSLAHSLCFGGFLPNGQVAFARVITDQATFANLVDVFVLEEYRGRGYSRQLMQAIVKDPRLQALRRFTLATADAHGLYAQFGFTPLAKPQSFMERYDPRIYQRSEENRTLQGE
jgi:N-acetylglutamate synthase-like GNAT family acetyltransferase